MPIDSSLLQRLLDEAPVFIYLKDNNLNLLYCNQTVADAFGTTVAALVGTKEEEVKTIEDQRKFAAADMEVIRTGQPATLNTTLHTPGGTLQLRDHKYPITIDGRRHRLSP